MACEIARGRGALQPELIACFAGHRIMSVDMCAPLAKAVTTAEVVEGLRDLFAAIPHADVVSITVLSWPDARTAACTDEQALELDDEHQRWPEFVETEQDAGTRVSLSVPLLIEGADGEQELAGLLNIYSHTALQ